MAQMKCVVVTPEKTVVDAQVEFVALPLYDGEIGIAPGHSPMIGRVGHGEMRLRDASGTRSFYVDGGFVQVADGVVSVLTNKALPASAIVAAEAEMLLAKSQSMSARSPELMAIRDRMAAQARGQLRMIRK